MVTEIAFDLKKDAPVEYREGGHEQQLTAFLIQNLIGLKHIKNVELVINNDLYMWAHCEKVLFVMIQTVQSSHCSIVQNAVEERERVNGPSERNRNFVHYKIDTVNTYAVHLSVEQRGKPPRELSFMAVHTQMVLRQKRGEFTRGIESALHPKPPDQPFMFMYFLDPSCCHVESYKSIITTASPARIKESVWEAVGKVFVGFSTSQAGHLNSRPP